MTQPRSRSGEDDGKGRVGERRGENIGVRRWGKEQARNMMSVC